MTPVIDYSGSRELVISFTITRSPYKRFVWRATRPVDIVDCKNEWRYFLKYNRNIFNNCSTNARWI